MSEALTKIQKELEGIEPDTIESVVSISDGDCKWLKISAAGFMDGDDFLCEELRGFITSMHPYCILWEPGQPPKKIPFVSYNEMPEGYEIRVDLKILLPDEEIIGLSLAPSSAKSLSRYVRRLQSMRVPLGQTLTALTTRSLLNKKGQRFTVIEFEAISQNLKNRGGKQQANFDEEIPPPMDPPIEVEAQDDLPF